jgi:integrase
VTAVATGAAEAAQDAGTARLAAALDGEFLTVLRWNPERKVLSFPQEHPQLGWRACVADGCDNPGVRAHQLCQGCLTRFEKTRVPLDGFVRMAKPREHRIGVELCAVRGCQRPWRSSGDPLCTSHSHQRSRTLRLSMPEFLAHPEVVPLPPFGPCQVAACPRGASGLSYCSSHQQRLRTVRRREPGFDERGWQRTAPAVAQHPHVSLRGLPDRVVAEVLYGLQERVGASRKTPDYLLRNYCDLVRAQQLGSVVELPSEGLRPGLLQLHKGFIRSVQRLTLAPETERRKDVWDSTAFGHSGMIRFTRIEQPWLRETLKRWAAEDLPRRRGNWGCNQTQRRINSMALLSESLRLQRADHGDVPASLGREDITAFCNRLAFLTTRGEIGESRRIAACRDVKAVLDRARKMGLARPGQPMAGLPDDFTLTRDDIPDSPEEQEAGKDLPAEVLTTVCEGLPLLEQMSSRETRTAVELLIDTGRRPDEICGLPWDCVDHDQDGKPVLVYDNSKAHRKERRLPITAATAALITGQQHWARERFPDTPASQLKLLPTSVANPDGRKPISRNALNTTHRRWVTALPPTMVPVKVEIDGREATQMRPFDKERIFPYAYRHTYAQRHADAGVAVDVLRDLMNHRQLDTTQRYYRVGEQRRREAVERVTTMQFDRHGNRVWRTAKAMLDSEHTRRAVGEVAVPYGGCSEPSNVAAGGGDCPIRFRCVGCGHFGTDISYLPDLERYLADLLRHRERLAATLDADEWATTEAMPSDAEITRIRRLIDRMKGDLDELAEEERAQIDEAVTVVRRGRAKITSLGMPRVRQPLPDLRPERTA